MKLNKYRTLIVKTGGFFVIWLLLSTSLNLMHVGLGLLASFAVAWLNTDRAVSRFMIVQLRFARYFIWLVGRILYSGFHLSVMILRPSLPIDPKMIHYRTHVHEEGGIVLMGNSITLTPGTITVEVNSQELVVHAMDDKSADDVTSLRLEKRIAGLLGQKGME